MENPTQDNGSADVNRRHFIGNSFATLMTLMGGVALVRSQSASGQSAAKSERYSGPPLKIGVIGCGFWGRDVITTLSRLPNAPVVAVCDTYGAYLRRAQNAAPNAEAFEDYKKLLASKEVEAVVVATPTHLHVEIVLAALEAGKHVYCEAPLAHTIEDARTIAQAARKHSSRVHFQAGLQKRSDPEVIYVLGFVRAGAAGTPMLARAQWHKKTSWRRASPNADQERALNWRLNRSTSPGLAGEIGIHQIDLASWWIDKRPSAVTAFGSVIQWRDGRDVADTVQAIVEYPGGSRAVYDATLGNSFDADYEMLYGSDATVMMRDRRAWMFKEVDAPLLGWEVYARKETFFKEVGIVLGANATKLAAQGDNPALDTQVASQGELYYALEAFVANADMIKTAVKDFEENFGAGDNDALAEYVADIGQRKLPHATFKDGYDATVIALKTNESIVSAKRVEFKDEWFEI